MKDDPFAQFLDEHFPKSDEETPPAVRLETGQERIEHSLRTEAKTDEHGEVLSAEQCRVIAKVLDVELEALRSYYHQSR